MTPLYDARGNRYAVVSPNTLRDWGVAVPNRPEHAAADHGAWAPAAIARTCLWPAGERPAGAKGHRCDGLLVGPFQDTAPFDLLIVNTDATLAERSGNGLTIFAQALADAGRVSGAHPVLLRVHHAHPSASSPLPTWVTPATHEGQAGFWLDLGKPAFGPQAVQAQAHALQHSAQAAGGISSVRRLSAIDPRWTRSVFVRIGNPHCVTLVNHDDHLPGFGPMHEAPLLDPLTQVAFATGALGSGEPCPAGVNLQWASRQGPQSIKARVFERGEGPTASSGTSASAVAAAAWLARWVGHGLVHVTMPGGTAPILLTDSDGELVQVMLFGAAQRCDP